MRFFGKSKEVSHPLAETHVWIVPLHVRPGASPLPAPLAGAYVQVFCRGDNATTAAWAAIQVIEAMGYSVPENPTTVNQMRAADYGAFVDANWSELRDELPSQEEFYERIADNRAVLGPFGGYEAPAP